MTPVAAAGLRARGRRGLGAVLAVAALVSAAACGGPGARAARSTGTTVSTATSTAPAPTEPAPTTSSLEPAPAATSTLPVATTAAPIAAALPAEEPATTLPTPVPPPPEQRVEPTQQVGHITIPRLGIDLAMFEGVTLPTLDLGPGHWPGTAMPGKPGNVVVAGHRVSHTRPFRNIDRLVEGDEVTFAVGTVTYRYVVTGHEIVTPDAVRIVDQTPEPTATLFACHPPGSTEFRWVVHLKLVPG